MVSFLWCNPILYLPLATAFSVKKKKSIVEHNDSANKSIETSKDILSPIFILYQIEHNTTRSIYGMLDSYFKFLIILVKIHNTYSIIK